MAIIDVIKYEGKNNVLAWKHPKEDYNTSAQLIVHESQEAIIFKDGKVLGPFGAGKHTLESDNIPGIRHIVGLATGGVSPNHCEVYFVNKAYSMAILWGTATPWTIQDPSLQIPFEMAAHGRFAVKVEDSKQLILKLVGTMNSFTQKNIQDYFYGEMISKIKDYISNLIISENISHAEISSKLSDIGNQVFCKLTDDFVKYGLILEEFVVENVSILKDKVYDDVRDAMGRRAINIITGMTEQERGGIEVAKLQAQNQGTGGQYGHMVSGFAAGAAMAPVMGSIIRNATDSVNAPRQGDIPHRDQFSMGVVKKEDSMNENITQLKCANCGAILAEGSRFCNKCGSAIESEKLQTIFCPICGAELSADSQFCNKCGAQL